MTTRLYYTDALMTAFDATVLACEPAADGFAIVLDRTAFYPTSGGQPFDTGRLGEARVSDVIDRDDGTIGHVVHAPIAPGSAVEGRIDWPRRFDHMQQHTGQHLLSAAFDRIHQARTLSFHLGADAATIDLSRDVTPETIARVEQDVNAVVWDDRPVGVRFVSDEEAARLAMRKPATRTGTLRIVEVPEYDISACGGTHVPRTGMVGLVAVSGWERYKGGSRVSFVCGGRALAAFGRLRDTVVAATRALSVAPGEIAATIERQRVESKDQARLQRRLQDEVAGHRAAAWRAGAEQIGGCRAVVREEPGWDAAALKSLALAVVGEPGMVVVLAGGGRPLPVVVARSADVRFDASAWLSEAIARFGGKGGGKPELAQGGLTAEPAAVLDFARIGLGA